MDLDERELDETDLDETDLDETDFDERDLGEMGDLVKLDLTTSNARLMGVWTPDLKP